MQDLTCEGGETKQLRYAKFHDVCVTIGGSFTSENLTP